MKKNFPNSLNIILILMLVSLLSVSITGCKSSLGENTIKSAFDQYVLPIGESVEIENIEILRRSKEDKEDTSLCQVEAVGETATYMIYFSVEYKYYEKGGWILENIYPADTDEWTATYNETGIKTVEDASEDVYNVFPAMPIAYNSMTYTWEENNSPRRVSTDNDGEQLAQVFNGSASYEDDFCTFSAPFQLIYFFDVSWQESEFVACWSPAYSYSGLLKDVNDCLRLDLSGTWVGESPYGAPLVLTLDMDESGYPYGELKFEVEADNFSHYPRGVGRGDIIDLGCSNMTYKSSGYSGYENYWTSPNFDLCGYGNQNYCGYGTDWVYLQDLVLDVNNRTLTGHYWRTYGTDFDVVLTWKGN